MPFKALWMVLSEPLFYIRTHYLDTHLPIYGPA